MGATNMPSTVDIWDDFFKLYYWDNILDLAREYPIEKSLVIQFNDIYNFNSDLANELLNTPDVVLEHANSALRNVILPVEISLDEANVRIANTPEKIRRRDIRQEHVGKLITIDGIVQRITEVIPKITTAAFSCQRCQQITYVRQDDTRFVEPYECENELCQRKNCFKLLSNESTKIDYQKIRIQELTEHLKGGEKSQTIDVDIFNDLTGQVLPGNRVTIIGILRAYQRVKANGKTPYEDLVLDANHIQINDVQEIVILTPQDIANMRAIAAQPDAIGRLVDSYAPSIHGMRNEKEGILCSSVSKGYKIRSDGTPQREYSHILICSDPGMAKSNLKMALKGIIPGLVLSSGTGSTKAGLTAAVVKDDFAGGSLSIEAGSLVLADGCGIALDEFDKFDKDDIRNLNDALSNCQFEIDKAGFHLKLWSRCFVVAFQNPKEGRFDRNTPFASQINIPPDTLSRFDLIFLISDDATEKKDKLIGDKIVDSWIGIDEESDIEVLSIDDMQKYIAYAQTIQPKIPLELKNIIVNKYVLARRKSEEGRIAVTARYVEALLRLAKAEAQLALSNIVTVEHVERACRIIDVGLSQTSVDEDGRLDSDIISTGKSKSQKEKIKLIKEIINTLAADHKGIAPEGELILQCIEKGFKDNEIMKL